MKRSTIGAAALSAAVWAMAAGAQDIAPKGGFEPGAKPIVPGKPPEKAPEPLPLTPKIDPEAIKAFGWFAELRDGCWRGKHSDGKTTDVQCYLFQYDRLMRGSIRIFREAAFTPSFEGDAVFSIDPAGGKKIIYTQWGSGGVYSTGEITFEGDTLVFRNRLPDGKEAETRSIWRKTEKGYKVTRERQVPDKGWESIAEVEYTRSR